MNNEIDPFDPYIELIYDGFGFKRPTQKVLIKILQLERDRHFSRDHDILYLSDMGIDSILQSYKNIQRKDLHSERSVGHNYTLQLLRVFHGDKQVSPHYFTQGAREVHQIKNTQQGNEYITKGKRSPILGILGTSGDLFMPLSEIHMDYHIIQKKII